MVHIFLLLGEQNQPLLAMVAELGELVGPEVPPVSQESNTEAEAEAAEMSALRFYLAEVEVPTVETEEPVELLTVTPTLEKTAPLLQRKILNTRGLDMEDLLRQIYTVPAEVVGVDTEVTEALEEKVGPHREATVSRAEAEAEADMVATVAQEALLE